MLVQTLGLAEEDGVVGSIPPVYESPSTRPSLHIPRQCLLSVLIPERSLSDFPAVYEPDYQSDEDCEDCEEEEVVIEGVDI